jgi:hypothetical protein
MLVFRDQSARVATRPLLASLARDTATLAREARPAYDDLVALLVDAGESASAVGDALCPTFDDTNRVVRQLERATRAVARAVCEGWAGSPEAAVDHLDVARQTMEDASRGELPLSVARPVSEGFAYYALSPESYIEAARRLASQARGVPCVCIGIRNIGTALGALVAATLEREGVDVWFCTVRPHGHPFARRTTLGPEMQRWFEARAHGYFAIVDEGPGLSGSTLTSVAAAVDALGVAPDRIVLMPSWETDGARFVSAEARDRWSRHARIAASFEPVWIDDGRLARAWSADRVEDLGAGRWRETLPPDEWPAAHPQHERRKFRVTRGPEVEWVKFAGYGHYGRRTLARAAQLGEAGWSPPARALGGGWMGLAVIDGVPADADDVSGDFLEHVAQYVAWTGRTFRLDTPAHGDALLAMTRHNALGALGDQAARAVDRLALPDEIVVASLLDARMLPHEWLQTSGGWVKTDSADHGDDHFYPGPCDVAWDLAAICEEFHLDAPAVRYLLDAYVRASGDRRVRSRLPFHRIAYTAARAGYTHEAARQLRHSDEGRRFHAEFLHYRARLRELMALPAVRRPESPAMAGADGSARA